MLWKWLRWRFWRVYRQIREPLEIKWSRLIGYKLAIWIDKRHPEQCWAARCVNIGLGWHFLFGRHDLSQRICKDDCARTGSCWCGKLRDEKREAEFFAEMRERVKQ